MNFFTPAELTANLVRSCKAKAELSLSRMLPLAILAGMLIAFGGAVTNTAGYDLSSFSMVRLVSGLLFPLGLGMVILSGAELFTGNCLMVLTLLEREITTAQMLKSWFWVYFGNAVGGLLVAAGCAFSGQLGYSAGKLAVFGIRLAAGKCALPFGNAVVQGFFCNLLVCLGVLLSGSAKDTLGKIAGAYLPVCYFVICGFEHCIANLFYIPVGLFAQMVPEYAQLAVAAGVDTAALNWGQMLFGNLIPVTLGNILGGTAVGLLFRAGHLSTIEARKV